MFCLFALARSNNTSALRPTTAAPAAANGSVQTLGSAILSIQTESLTPGTYQVTAITRTDGSTIFLGLISVQDPTAQPEREAGDSRNHDDSTHQSRTLISRSELHLPQGLTIADLSRINVSDLRGNHILTATLL
ncbi:MAG: hypothetical protein C5B50_14030 [Verrucomicrobia bacterium]|nr:MAG: hypothetical protein C5B50_14030 [Verrucomicrobiota bacterium]